MPDSGKSILKRWIGLALIPRSNWKSLLIAMFDKPSPNKRVDCIPHGGNLLRPRPFPRLRLLNSQKLFGIPERILNCPSVCVCGDQQPGIKGEIGGEEEVILLDSLRITRDDQADVFSGQHFVPDDMAHDHQSLFFLPALDCIHEPPVFCRSGNLRGRRQSHPSTWRSSLLSFDPLGHSIDCRVASNAADNKYVLGHSSSKRSIEPVSDKKYLLFRKPLDHLDNHLFQQIKKGFSRCLARTLTRQGRRSARVILPKGRSDKAFFDSIRNRKITA